MECKVHYRKKSEMGRGRLLSDSYFENKQHNRRSASLGKRSNLGTPKNLYTETDTLDLVAEIKTIQKLLSSGIDLVRNEEIPLFQAFLCILNTSKFKNLSSLTFKDLLGILRSKDLQNAFLTFSQKLRKTSDFSIWIQSALKESIKFYCQIDKTLYGYPLTKAISSFIEGCYTRHKFIFKPVRFIDYFQSLPSPQNYFSNPSDWSKLFMPEMQIETTKDDEDNLYINTMGDEKEYEEILDINSSPVLNTEPDSRNTLVSMFFQKHSAINPYNSSQPIKIATGLARQQALKRSDPKVRTEKWNKYFTESIYLKKLGLGFVSFINKLGNTWQAEEADLVTWVYKNKAELIDQYLKTSSINSEEIPQVKHQAMIKHLGDKKTLRDLFKQ